VPAPYRLAERHRQAGARIVDGLGTHLAVGDELCHLGQPRANAVLVDCRKLQRAESRQRALVALRPVVLQRPGRDVRALGLKDLLPELAERARTSPRRTSSTATARAATAAERVVNPRRDVRRPSSWRKTNRQRVPAVVL
jgi:hypothetical protein